MLWSYLHKILNFFQVQRRHLEWRSNSLKLLCFGAKRQLDFTLLNTKWNKPFLVPEFSKFSSEMFSLSLHKVNCLSFFSTKEWTNLFSIQSFTETIFFYFRCLVISETLGGFLLRECWHNEVIRASVTSATANVDKNLQKDSSIQIKVFLPKHLAKQELGFGRYKLEMIWKAFGGRCWLTWKFHTAKIDYTWKI